MVELGKRKVLLYHPRTEHENNYMNYWIPYSLLSIAAFAPPTVEVFIHDENLSGPIQDNELNDFLESSMCIGISCMTGRQIWNGLEFLKRVRPLKPEMPIIWGGAHPSLFPEQIIESGYGDIVIQGPGEVLFRTVLEVLINEDDSWPRIPGLTWRRGNDTHFGEVGPTRKCVNYPTFPWALINLKQYVRHDPKIAERTINYVSSLGCPYRCGFCSEVALHRRAWSALPASRVASDVEHLIKESESIAVKFYDANFFVDPRRVLEFAQTIKYWNIKWAASCHPQTLLRLKDSDLRLLSESGLCRLLVGMESGVPAVLQLIGKDISVSDMYQISARLNHYGIIGSFTFIVGFPGVGNDMSPTLKIGRELRKSCPEHEVKIHLYAPYPGTPLWPLALRHGFRPPSALRDWADFDYYASTTPWIPHSWEGEIREFNKEHCPYVAL